MAYNKLLGRLKQTPQSRQARPDQVPNNAGGFAFAIDKWEQLNRFLLIGSEGGTYYVTARDLTVQNLDAVKACIQEDGVRVVKQTADISVQGRAIKNDPAILVLAAALSYGDNATKQAARAAIVDVCRTGTHILHFAAYADKLRRWGRGLRSTVQQWYDVHGNKNADALAYQMVKYQSRDGWSHKDLIRKAHPGSDDTLVASLFDWALHGYKAEKTYPAIVQTFETAKTAASEQIADMIADNGLSREMIPTDKLNDPVIARALARNAPLTATIRNLGNMSKADLLNPGDEVFERVIKLLGDAGALKKARVHPIALLIALRTYASGRGVKGSGSWPVVPQIVDALNNAFYLAFETVEPLSKNLLIAVDSSGSMNANVVGTPGFSAAQASAAMALVTASTERNYKTVAFDTQVYDWPISPRQRLDDVIKNIPGGGGTDVSAPINILIQQKRKVDAVIIYTDNETWAGNNHPYQAMATYREKVNRNTKLIIVATAANHVSVAAPDDPLSLTICGFDTTVPDVIRTFLVD
jgi:60 kDa SS-A/Ro ribonucleoprotein